MLVVSNLAFFNSFLTDAAVEAFFKRFAVIATSIGPAFCQTIFVLLLGYYCTTSTRAKITGFYTHTKIIQDFDRRLTNK